MSCRIKKGLPDEAALFRFGPTAFKVTGQTIARSDHGRIIGIRGELK
jgi:hypothetical protein